MAKNAITDYSETAASNTDIGGTGIVGTAAVSNMDNAVREIMADLAAVNKGSAPVADTWTFGDPADLTKRARLDAGGVTAGQTRVLAAPDRDGTIALSPAVTVDNTVPRYDGVAGALQTSGVVVSDANAMSGLTSASISSTTAGTLLSVESTDAGAASGPDVDLYRNSASPAVSDILASLLWSSKDSAGNKEVVAAIRAVVLDAVNGTEDTDLVFRTIVAGALADRLHIRAGAYMDGATGGDPGAGKFNATELQQAGAPVRPLISGTSQATTSGTSKDFTSIPSWAQRVTINLSNVSTNGTSPIIIQIGSGSIATTGYMGAGGGQDTSGGSIVNFTAGFGLVSPGAAADFINGVGTLTLLDAATNTWAFGWSGGISNGNYVLIGGGSKVLSGVLDRVRLTTLGGTAAFDSGVANIMYE